MNSATTLLTSAVRQLGGAERDGQRQMCTEVERTLEAPGALLVQAGTGTGKSLGYLVPVLAEAVRAGRRAVISTATLALQRQLLTHDVPLVTDVVAEAGLGRPDVVVLKGWQNYLCRHKIAGGYPGDDAPELFSVDVASGDPTEARRGGSLSEEVVRLREWADVTDTGDRDDLDPGVSDRAWRQVSISKLECLGAKCPMIAECFPEAAREAAHAADVVITNHAMLGIAASGSPNVLPEHEILVVDEAHELADRVTSQSAMELSVASVERTTSLVRQHTKAETATLEAASTALRHALEEAPDGRILDPSARLLDAVTLVESASRQAISDAKPDPGAEAGGIQLARSALVVLHEIAERLLSDRLAERRDVLWCERGRLGADAPRLRLAPLEVSGSIAADLLDGRSTVLTSATLALGGRFDAAARTLGLTLLGTIAAASEQDERTGDETGDAIRRGESQPDRAASGQRESVAPDPAAAPLWRAVDVGSPFDYGRQAIRYVARHLPPPGRDGTAVEARRELVELVEASGGAALGLFSSRRAAEDAAAVLRTELGIPVLCQGEDQLPALIRRFAEDEETCLMGTLSLWQGVDVPGRSCRLVVIDRIPFPRPDDPIRSARAEVVTAAGGNGFMSVAASHAALLLAQGAGRLVRSTSDRGVLAILDSRAATARYASYLVQSLPPMWPTTDASTVRQALRRLASG